MYVVFFFQSKTDMLSNLLEIEVAYSLLKTGDEGGKDPLDVHYEKLKTDMEVGVIKFYICIIGLEVL